MAQQGHHPGQVLRQLPIKIVLSDQPALELAGQSPAPRSLIHQLANSICFKSLLLRYGLEVLEDDMVSIHERLSKAEARARGANQSEARKGPKKARRPASQIERLFVCSAPGCGRSYGSSISLNLHRRLKHAVFIED